MLKVNVIKLVVDNSFTLTEKLNADIFNNSAEIIAKNLTEKFKDVVMTDREASITIQVDREKGLTFDRNYQIKDNL